MSKDKKKKKKDKKGGPENGVAAKASKGFQTLTQNPLVADVVAAALVATASALKDTNKARRLAEYAGDELEALSKKSAERGNAMWKLALDIGRQALDTFATEPAPSKKSASAKSPTAKPGSPKRPARNKSAPKSSAAKTNSAKKSSPKKSAPKKSARTVRKAK